MTKKSGPEFALFDTAEVRSIVFNGILRTSPKVQALVRRGRFEDVEKLDLFPVLEGIVEQVESGEESDKAIATVVRCGVEQEAAVSLVNAATKYLTKQIEQAMPQVTLGCLERTDDVYVRVTLVAYDEVLVTFNAW